MARPLPTAPASSAAAAPGERPAVKPGGLRVLVAEDNEVNQKVVSRMLERLGHSAEIAVNGTDAFEPATASSFDIVLMDCQMPEMDGFEATARIRAALVGRRRIPILALTANASDADRQRCLDAGMDAHLSKPLKLEKLAEALATWGPTAAEAKRPASRGPLRRRRGTSNPISNFQGSCDSAPIAPATSSSASADRGFPGR
jgi:CheY-like chemotaxis protein